MTICVFSLQYVYVHSYEDAALSAMICASIHFEVAIAIAAVLFGFSLGAALAIVVRGLI